MKKAWWKSLQVKIIGWSFVPTVIILSAVAWFTFYSYQKVLGDLGLILLSATWFARFDPSREGIRRLRIKSGETKKCEPHKKVPRITLPSLSPLVSKLAQLHPSWGCCLPSCACYSTAASGGGGSASPG